MAENGGDDTVRWLTVREAAHKASVDPDTIRKWANKGLIATKRTAGNHRRVDPVSLDRARRDATRLAQKRLPGPMADVADFSHRIADLDTFTVPQHVHTDVIAATRMLADDVAKVMTRFSEMLADEERERDRAAIAKAERKDQALIKSMLKQHRSL